MRNNFEVKTFFENNNQDIVINLSGYNHNTILHKYDGDDVEIKKQIQVNIEGNLNILANCLPSMREKKYGRNERVMVKLSDGSTEFMKYKKAQPLLLSGAEIL